MALLKLCRCGKPIDISISLCNSCKEKSKERHKQYDLYARDQKSRAFYNGKAWRLKRQEALVRDNGLCQRCFKNKRITKADMVDHVIPIKIDWSKRLDINNLQSLCNSCHNSKTAEDKKKYEG